MQRSVIADCQPGNSAALWGLMDAVGYREQFHALLGPLEQPGGKSPMPGVRGTLTSAPPLSQSIPWLSHPLLSEPRSQQHLAQSRIILQAQGNSAGAEPRQGKGQGGVTGCQGLFHANIWNVLTIPLYWLPVNSYCCWNSSTIPSWLVVFLRGFFQKPCPVQGLETDLSWMQGKRLYTKNHRNIHTA